ncbi:MAG TPA: hypothetical protein VJ376_12675 [Pseudomonadota bacterium]|nr:hypothetical protein [Pseudomonadota bacterium]
MKHPHTPTPWYDNDNGLIYGTPAEDQDEAPFVADVISDRECAAFGIMTDTERANMAFIVSACNVHHDLVATLKLALEALNTARRFRVNDTDSYAIASRIDAALKKAGVQP